MGKYNHYKPKYVVNCNSVTVELPFSEMCFGGELVHHNHCLYSLFTWNHLIDIFSGYSYNRQHN